MPGTLLEQLGWLSEAGFGTVEVYWKEMDLALIGGINGHLHMPWGHGDDPTASHKGGHGQRTVDGTSTRHEHEATGRIDGMTQDRPGKACTAIPDSPGCTRTRAARRTGTTSSASTCSRT